LSAKLIISVLIFIACIIGVEYYFGWAELVKPWRSLPPLAVLVALGLAFFSYMVRAYRVYDYFGDTVRGHFLTTLRIVLQHNLLNMMLPMRTGELGFPVLMKRYFNTPAMESVPALFWFRLLDLHTVLTLGLIALGSYWFAWYWVVVGVVGMMIVPIIAFFAHHQLLNILAGHEGKLFSFIHKALDSLPKTRTEFWHSWALTLFNWLVKFASFAWVFAQFAPMPWTAALGGVIGGDLASALPIHGVAGAGTFEAGVVFAAVLFDLGADEALAAAVNLHLFILSSILTGGLVSLFLKSRVQQPQG